MNVFVHVASSNIDVGESVDEMSQVLRWNIGNEIVGSVNILYEL